MQTADTDRRETALPPLITTSSGSLALLINRKTFVNLEKAWNDKHLEEGKERKGGSTKGYVVCVKDGGRRGGWMKRGEEEDRGSERKERNESWVEGGEGRKRLQEEKRGFRRGREGKETEKGEKDENKIST